MDVSKLIEKAREATERRNYEYAIDLYLQSCRLNPDHPTARRELRAVENRQTKEKGTSFWTKTKGTGLAMQVHGFFAAKKYDTVIEKAEDALKVDPGNMGIMMVLGRALMHAGHRTSAIATFEDIKLANGGGNTKLLVEALRELAFAYEGAGRISDAQDVWNVVLKNVPGDRDATVKMRDLSAKTMSENIQQAALTGKRGGAAISTQTEKQKKEAELLDLEKGEIKTPEDLRRMIEHTKSQIQARSDDPKLYSKLGDLHRQGNNYEESKRAYALACEKDPNNPSYPFKLHDLEIWKMSSALRPLDAKAQSGDVLARQQAEKSRIALMEYRLNSFIEREKRYSTDSRIRFELGCIYHDLAAIKKDNSLYDQAIMRFQFTYNDPKFRTDSGLKMAIGFKEKGQYELALKRIDETLAKLELKNEIWKNLKYERGDALVRAGKRDEAKKTFLEIYEIDVSFRDVAKRVDELSKP